MKNIKTGRGAAEVGLTGEEVKVLYDFIKFLTYLGLIVLIIRTIFRLLKWLYRAIWPARTQTKQRTKCHVSRKNRQKSNSRKSNGIRPGGISMTRRGCGLLLTISITIPIPNGRLAGTTNPNQQNNSKVKRLPARKCAGSRLGSPFVFCLNLHV